MCLSWGLIGAQFAFTGVFRASGNMVINMTLTIASQWLLQLPLAYVLSKHTSLGAEGIYWAMPITNVVTVAITAAIYAHGGWRKKRLIDKEEINVTEEILKDEGMR
jgi:Na+-driven multidrug efflux pump